MLENLCEVLMKLVQVWLGSTDPELEESRHVRDGQVHGGHRRCEIGKYPTLGVVVIASLEECGAHTGN